MMMSLAVTGLLGMFALSVQTPPPTTAPAAQTPAATEQAGQTASPELVGKIANELKVTPKQAEGGAGALLGLAKQRLKPEEFKEVSDAIPGTDGLLSAASSAASTSGMGAMAGMSKSAAGLASVAGTFKQLGLSPDMATKMVPVLTNFAQSKGAAGAAKLLAGALK
jgi:hypothetical protein